MRKDQQRTKAQLEGELASLRLRLAEYENKIKNFENAAKESTESDAFRKVMLDNSVVGICFVRRRTLIWANSQVAELLKIPLDRLLGASTRVIYASDREFEEKGKEEYAALGRGEWFDFQLRVTRSDGSVFVARVAGKAVHPSMPQEGSVWILEDITEQEKAQALLREREAKYRLLVDNVCDLIWTIDIDGIFTYASPSWKRVLGYEEEVFVGKSFQTFVHPDDVAVCRKALQNLVKQKKQMAGLICKVRHADDTWHWHTMGASPIFRPDGSFEHAIDVSRDITEQKLAEEAMKLSEAKLRSVFDATPVGLFILKDRMLLAANNAWYQNIGYVASEIVGRSTRLLYEDAAEYERVGQKLYAEVVGRNANTVETRIIRKDGVWRDVVLTASPLQVGDIFSGVVVAMEDITERKRTDDILREQRRQLADIIEFLPDATVIIDKNRQVIGWNRAMENLTGIRKEDMIGKGDYEYALPFYGYGRPMLVDLALASDYEAEGRYAVFKRTGDILHAEAYTSDLLPEDVYFSATASVLRNVNGEITAAIECIRDMTERQKLTDRLNRAEKMETVGMLAGGVAHDLNNVLGVLVGYSELLINGLSEGHRFRDYAENILKSSLRGAAIIQDLLTLTRRGVAVSKVVHLNQVVADCLVSLELGRLKAYHPEVAITTKLDDNLLCVKGSVIHLSKAVMNLVSNAIEAISGAGEVIIQTENRYLDNAIRGYDEIQEGEYVVLNVSDTGSGISEKDRARIFEPFYTRKVMGRSGTGLGLTVVWGTVKDHQGYIDVFSEEGKGSTFFLYLPATREQGHKTKKEALAPGAFHGRGESILVVDDVRAQRDLARSILDLLGYRVETVAGGEQALTFLQDKKMDLVLLDMIMDPGIDGMETYRKILEIHPSQKAILVSGFTETDKVKKTLEMGAGAFIRKPYLIDKIGEAIRKELDRP